MVFATAVFLLLGLSGCSYEIDYEYISLIDSMEVIESGQPDVSGIHDHSNMPLRYRLERDTYVIHPVFDEGANRPTIVFSVESKQNGKLGISAEPIPCYMHEVVILATEVDYKGFSADGVKLRWPLGRLPPPCDNRGPLAEDEQVIRLSVFDARTGKIADEKIRFSVETNGGRTIYDSL